MAKQVHIRLDDFVYETLAGYTAEAGLSAQEAVSAAVMEYLSRRHVEAAPARGFTFADLFAGIGGMRIAFERAGGSCVWSCEWNKYCQQTYFANFGELPVGDVTQVDALAAATRRRRRAGGKSRGSRGSGGGGPGRSPWAMVLHAPASVPSACNN